jgi:hypothetical protein
MAERPIHTTCLRVWATAVSATLALAASAAAAAPALAAGTRPQLAVFALSPVGTPGAVLLHGAAGRTLRGSVSVRNLSRNRISVRLQRADIANASNGNASYITAGVRHTGRWLHLQTGTVGLAAHATRRVGYTIRIPRGTTGASHYAGIVAVNAAELAEAHAHPRHSQHSFNFHRIDRQAIPITVRMRGPLVRRLTLGSVRLSVKPVGAAVLLGLAPGGSDLIESTAVKLHVLRGRHAVFSTNTTLGQLFPGAPLAYRIPWKGRPAAGSYRVVGTIRPQGARVIHVNASLTVSGAKAKQLAQGTAAATQQQAATSIPGWIWIALTLAAVLLIVVPLFVWKHARRGGSTPVAGS